MEKIHYSSQEMYTSCRSCWITVLVLPTHVFGEAILQTSKKLTYSYSIQIHVFGEAILQTSKKLTYSYNIQIIHILVHWNPVENGERTHIFFVILIIVSSVSS
jgi:hypothetical protein